MCCNGEEIGYEDIIPKWMQNLKEDLGTYAKKQIPPEYGKEPRLATPLPKDFPISAGVSPMSLYGADLIRRMSGYPMPYGGLTTPGYAPTMSYGYGPTTPTPPTPDGDGDDRGKKKADDEETPGKKKDENGENGNDDIERNPRITDFATAGMSPFELYKLTSMLGAISDPYSARQQQAKKRYLK